MPKLASPMSACGIGAGIDEERRMMMETKLGYILAAIDALGFIGLIYLIATAKYNDKIDGEDGW